MTLCAASLCPLGIFAQGKIRQVISIDKMFALADQNSKTMRPEMTGINEAREALKVARTALLPEIDASFSVSYLGDGYMVDRSFSSGMKAPVPHFGNNFALEVSQVMPAALFPA